MIIFKTLPVYDGDFIIGIFNWIIKNICTIELDGQIYCISNLSTAKNIFEKDGNLLIEYEKNNNFYLNYKIFDRFPIYVDRDDIIYFTHKDSGSTLIYTKHDTLTKFIDLIRQKYQINQTTEKVYVSTYLSSGVTPIDPQRNFDSIVSIHKDYIMKILKTFESKIHSKNIYDPKNLGILLYGLPGCGKTSMIIAIALYFKRNIIIADLRKIRTRKQFKELLMSCKDYIIVLDEFDHLISSMSSVDKKKELMILLDRMSECKTEETKKSLNEQYNRLKDEVEDSFDIYTFLTEMDGIEEYKGRIIIATTNNVDKIPESMKRPGRFDHIIKLNKFVKCEIIQLLNKMYGVAQETLNQYEFPPLVWSPAEIINLYRKGHNLTECIDILLKERLF